jgi:hypothetical protein
VVECRARANAAICCHFTDCVASNTSLLRAKLAAQDVALPLSCCRRGGRLLSPMLNGCLLRFKCHQSASLAGPWPMHSSAAVRLAGTRGLRARNTILDNNCYSPVLLSTRLSRRCPLSACSKLTRCAGCCVRPEHRWSPVIRLRMPAADAGMDRWPWSGLRGCGCACHPQPRIQRRLSLQQERGTGSPLARAMVRHLLGQGRTTPAEQHGIQSQGEKQQRQIEKARLSGETRFTPTASSAALTGRPHNAI